MSLVGPVRTAIRRRIRSGAVLTTPARSRPFVVQSIDDRGVTLLLGAKEARTVFTWECLEGVAPFLSGRDWVPIGGGFNSTGDPSTLDGYLKQHVNRATAGWVAALLEKAEVVDLDRSRPGRVRLQQTLK